MHRDEIVFLVRHTLSSSAEGTEIRSVLNVPRNGLWNLFNIVGGPNQEFLELEKGVKEEFAKSKPAAKVACRLLNKPDVKEAADQKAK